MALVGQDGEQISKLWDGRLGRQSDVLPDRVVETPIDRVRSYSEVEKKLTELDKAKEIAIKLPGGRGHWVGPLRGESFEEHARRYRQQTTDAKPLSHDTVKEIARDQLRVPPAPTLEEYAEKLQREADVKMVADRDSESRRQWLIRGLSRFIQDAEMPNTDLKVLARALHIITCYDD